jgi:hypothetical protein
MPKTKPPKADISFLKDAGCPPAARGNNPKTERAFVKSRHFAKSSFRGVGVHLGQNLVEVSGGEITLHLLVPMVICPGVKTRCNVRSFLKSELLNRFFDLSNAHIETLPVDRKIGNILASGIASWEKRRATGKSQ